MVKNLTISGQRTKLSPKDVMTLLGEAYECGLIPNSPDCMTAKELAVTSWYAAQIFLITVRSKCLQERTEATYILKGSKAPLIEIQNLDIVNNSPVSKPDIPGLIITKKEFSASYTLGKNRYYVMVLQGARGKALRDLVKEAADMDEKKLKVVENAYSAFGRVTGQFHQKFQINCQDVLCPTVIHGDLHYENVFFDPDENTVYFIDNESLAYSINHKADPANDLTRVYFYSAAILKPSLRFPPSMPDTILANITLKPFLEAYAATYPAEKKERLKEKLRGILLKNAFRIFFEYTSGKPQVYDPIRLWKLQKNYVKPIIDNLD